MRALIVGGYGFAGRHLAHYLVKCGDDVAVTYLPEERTDVLASQDPKSKLAKGKVGNRISLPQSAQTLALDITDKKAVDQIIALLKPDAVYHLAAISSVQESETAGQKVFDVNFFGTKNLLDAIREHSPASRFLFVSSAEVYGEPRPGILPILETAELRPQNAYAVSKAAAEMAVFEAYAKHGLHTVRVRPFPHTGPGQADRFALSNFAKQIAEIRLGKAEPSIKTGNLEVKRDYSDVSDVVRAYRDAIENGKPGEAYNISSGEGKSINELLQLLISCSGVEVEVVPDPERMRPVDVMEIYGSSQKAQRDFGWKPRVEREASMDSLLAYWMESIAG